jgi:hypothetical protein
VTFDQSFPSVEQRSLDSRLDPSTIVIPVDNQAFDPYATSCAMKSHVVPVGFLHVSPWSLDQQSVRVAVSAPV